MRPWYVDESDAQPRVLVAGVQVEADPVDDYDVATKRYVDSGAQGHTDTVTEGETGPSVSTRNGVQSLFAFWSGFDANVSGHGYFEVQIDNNADFSSPVATVRTKSNWASFDDLTTGTAYYVRVRAWDAEGNKTAWASTAGQTTNEVDTGDLANDAVTTVKIANLAVTNAKINDLDVSKLNAGTITSKTITIAGGTAGVIQSSGFTSGSAGWRIRGNGDAEFNDVEVRGTVHSAEFYGTMKFGSPLGLISTQGRINYTEDTTDHGGGNLVDWAYIDIQPPDDSTARGRVTLRVRGDSGGTALSNYSRVEVLNGQFYVAPAGTEDAPSVAIGEQDFGFYKDGTQAVSLTINGVRAYAMNSDGLRPDPDNTMDLGSGSLRWDDVYATNGTIQTSDPAQKTEVVVSDLGLDFIRALQFVSWTWPGRQRRHYGIDLDSVVAALDGKDFGGYVDPAVTGQQGPKGLRYHEMIGPLGKAVQEIADRVMAIEDALNLP